MGGLGSSPRFVVGTRAFPNELHNWLEENDISKPREPELPGNFPLARPFSALNNELLDGVGAKPAEVYFDSLVGGPCIPGAMLPSDPFEGH